MGCLERVPGARVLQVAIGSLPAMFGLLGTVRAHSQGLSYNWNMYGHDAQHSAISANPSQPLSAIHWSSAVDLNPQYSGGDLFIHYGSPLITRANTLILPVKTGTTGGFKFDGHSAATRALVWAMDSDYTLPPPDLGPSCSGRITPPNRFYF